MHELLESIVKYKTVKNTRSRSDLYEEFLEKLQVFYGYNMDLLQVFGKMYAPVEMI